MWNYKSQVENLKTTVCTITNVLRDADSKRELSPITQDFVQKLKAAVYDADDLFDELNTRAELKLLDGDKDDTCFEEVCLFFLDKIKEVCLAYNMSHKVQDINKQLTISVSNHKNFGLGVDGYTLRTPRRDESRETCSHLIEKIIGRDGDKEDVINKFGLNDVQESFRVVTIVGVGGLGKTTLARLVYNNKKVQEEFPEFRLWVCVSDEGGQQFDVKVILCKILELDSDQKLGDTSSMQLVNDQFQEKLRGQKYLLVLDDVWNEDFRKWKDLLEFLKLGQEGSQIVVTTRSVRTVEVIGKTHIHTLKGLSEEDSWELFQSVAFNKEEQEHNNHPNPDLVDIRKKIVKNCCNIPLAIKAVGSLLHGEPVEKWLTIEHSSGLAGIGNGDNSIATIALVSL